VKLEKGKQQEIHDMNIRNEVCILILTTFNNISYSDWQTISLLLGESKEKIHIHNLVMDSSYLADLQGLEVRRSGPLSHDDPEFRKHDTEWIYEPGLHIGISSGEEGHHIVFMVRIRYAKYRIIL
jgi:hypothetical protein